MNTDFTQNNYVGRFVKIFDGGFGVIVSYIQQLDNDHFEIAKVDFDTVERLQEDEFQILKYPSIKDQNDIDTILEDINE